MKKLLSLIVVLGSLLFFTSEAKADCFVDGQEVAVFSDSSLQDGAFATMRTMMTPYGPMMQRVILYNPMVMSSMLPITRSFLMTHECGHHMLHHELSRLYPQFREQEADCYSIRWIASQDWFTEELYATLKRDMMAHWNAGDSQHFPVHVRVANLDRCLGRN